MAGCGSNSQKPLPLDDGEGMGDGEWASSPVPLSPDEMSLRQNKLPRETQNISAECERELTVYPVVQLPVLVRRFVGTTRVCSR